MIPVEVSEAANADLDDIFDYGADRWGLDAAEAYVRRFTATCDLIAEHPLSGAIHDWMYPPIRSLPFGRHRVFYDLTGDHAIVRRVLHKAVDLARHL